MKILCEWYEEDGRGMIVGRDEAGKEVGTMPSSEPILHYDDSCGLAASFLEAVGITVDLRDVSAEIDGEYLHITIA